MHTPITYYGGKQSMTGLIVPLLPPHTSYIEPFAGGAAVFFAKARADVEVLNDTNREIINFYRVIQTRFVALRKLVRSTLHSRSAHEDARIIYARPHLFSDVQRAWAFWVLANQSFMATLIGAWSYSRKGIAGARARTCERKRLEFTALYAERLARVQLECDDALAVIRRYDAPHALFYVDPPYFNACMGHYGGYTRADFTALLEVLSGIQGKFLLSSYPSDVLDEYAAAHGWHRTEHGSRIAVNARGAQKAKTEVLTSNYAQEAAR